MFPGVSKFRGFSAQLNRLIIVLNIETPLSAKMGLSYFRIIDIKREEIARMRAIARGEFTKMVAIGEIDIKGQSRRVVQLSNRDPSIPPGAPKHPTRYQPYDRYKRPDNRGADKRDATDINKRGDDKRGGRRPYYLRDRRGKGSDRHSDIADVRRDRNRNRQQAPGKNRNQRDRCGLKRDMEWG